MGLVGNILEFLGNFVGSNTSSNKSSWKQTFWMPASSVCRVAPNQILSSYPTFVTDPTVIESVVVLAPLNTPIILAQGLDVIGIDVYVNRTRLVQIYTKSK